MALRTPLLDRVALMAVPLFAVPFLPSCCTISNGVLAIVEGDWLEAPVLGYCHKLPFDRAIKEQVVVVLKKEWKTHPPYRSVCAAFVTLTQTIAGLAVALPTDHYCSHSTPSRRRRRPLWLPGGCC